MQIVISRFELAHLINKLPVELSFHSWFSTDFDLVNTRNAFFLCF